MTNQFYIKSIEKIKEGKLAEAILFLDKAIEEEPNNPIYYSERGVCYANSNQLGKALEDMNKSVDLDPNYSYRYASRAYIKDRMGDTKGGIEDYQIAINLDPKDAVAHNNLGLLQEKLGYKNLSKKNFEKADKLIDKTDVNSSVLPVPKSNKTTEIKQNLPNESVFSWIKKIFSDKKVRIEFWQFIKKGGRIK